MQKEKATGIFGAEKNNSHFFYLGIPWNERRSSHSYDLEGFDLDENENNIL